MVSDLRGIQREFRGGSFSSSLRSLLVWNWLCVARRILYQRISLAALYKVRALLSLSISWRSLQVRMKRKISRIYVRNGLLGASRCIMAIREIIRNSKTRLWVRYALPWSFTWDFYFRNQFVSRRRRDVAAKKSQGIDGEAEKDRVSYPSRTRVHLFLNSIVYF